MTKTFIPMALAAVLIVPGITLAASYHYVDSSGTIQTIEAANAQQALAIATAQNPDTGVALDMGLLEEGMEVAALTNTSGIGGSGDASAITYQYVDTDGDVRSVEAANAQQALVTAPAIEENSGVIRAEYQHIPTSVEVPVQ